MTELARTTRARRVARPAGGRQLLVYSPVSSSWGSRVVAAARSDIPRGVSVFRCRTKTELFHRCSSSEPGSVVLVDGSMPDDVVDRPSERLIRRISIIAPQLRIVSAVLDPTPDVYAGAVRAGAEVVNADARLAGALGWCADASPAHVGFHTHGRPRWTVEAWGDWVRRSYGITVAPWTEPALASLAGGTERAVLVQDLVDAQIVSRREFAVRAVRQLSKGLAAEEHRNTGTVSREAHRVLAGLACARPLCWRPGETVSLERASEALHAEPSLATAARLTADERDDLQAVCAAILGARARAAPVVGAPNAGRGRQERRWAAGRRAADLGADAASVDALAEAILEKATDAAHAVLDARYDALTEPGARLVAALVAITRLPTSMWPGDVSLVDGQPVFAGWEAAKLLSADVLPLDSEQIHQVVMALDARLRNLGRWAEARAQLV